MKTNTIHYTLLGLKSEVWSVFLLDFRLPSNPQIYGNPNPARRI